LGEKGELLSHNMYAYCHNDPINKYDPSGYKFIDWLTNLQMFGGGGSLGRSHGGGGPLSGGSANGVGINIKAAPRGGSYKPTLGRSVKGVSNPKEVKKLNEWLSDDKKLLDEVTDWYKDKPEWWGIDPENSDVFYRTPDEVKEIRKKVGESGGHHPHGLALGGAEGQKLTPTGETAKVKNPTHSQVTGLQRRVINRIKKQLK
ncbi:MAG: hypothetical protein ACRC7N_12810, partial [Clostridium sp.]